MITPPRRRTTATPQLAGQSYPPRASSSHHRHQAPKSGGGGAALWIALVLVVGLGGVYFITRDTWEQDNRAFLLGLKKDAEAARPTAKKLAYQKYDALIKAAGPRKLKDAEIIALLEEAKINRSKLSDEIALEEKVIEEAKLRGVAPNGARSPGDLKVSEAIYAKYEDKSRLLIDAFQRTRSDVEIGTDSAKYQENLREMKFQYDKWYDALTNAEASHPSAKLMKVALESYRTAGSWWTIETDKKMPEALYAPIMRKNEWVKADSALTRMKRCMNDKDVVERKKCGPCDGSGKIKCVICLGRGTCEYCKGKGNDVLKCCTAGACDACKGRRESTCPLCAGEGVFPGK